MLPDTFTHATLTIYQLTLDFVRFLGSLLQSPFRSPQANSHCERLIGSLRRNCLDFLIPINERHLKENLKDWKSHYCQARPHASLGPGLPEPGDGLPVPLQQQRHQIPMEYRVSAKPILGGLRHEYRLEKIAA
jgi:putative transposase